MSGRFFIKFIQKNMRLRISKDLELSAVPHSLLTTDINNEAKYIAPGTSGQILSLVAGVPTWVTIPTQCEITSNASGLKLADTFYDSLIDDVTGTKTTYDKTLSSQEVYFIRDGCSLKGYVNNLAISNLNENIAVPVDSNGAADFTYAHASLVHNDKMYLGLRAALTVTGDCELLCYPDCNDLSVFQSINLGPSVGFTNSLEALCYEPVTDKIIGPLSETKKLVVADPANITSYTTPTLSIPNNLGTSCPILPDGLGNIYAFTGGSSPTILKIDATTFTILSTTALPGGAEPHAGVINTADGFLYLVTGGGLFSKVDLSTMAITQLTLPATHIISTDDMAYIPGDPTFLSYGNPNLVIIGCEIRNRHTPDAGAILLDADNMTYQGMDILPNWGIWYDIPTEMVYVASNQGFVETIPFTKLYDFYLTSITSIAFETTVYTARGMQPNEIMVTSCGVFITTWGPNVAPAPAGRLIRVDLVKVENPVMTKKEVYYRG